MSSANYHLLSKQSYDLDDPPANHQGPIVSRVAAEHWAPSFQTDRPILRPALIMLITGGHMLQSDSDGNQLEIGPGQALVFRGNTARQQRVTSNDGLRVLVAIYDPSSLNQLWPSHWQQPIIRIEGANAALPLFQELLSSARQASQNVHAICAHLSSALLLQLADISRQHDDCASAGETRFLMSRQILWQNYERLSSVAELAHECGVSQVYLTRLFRRHADQTPGDMLRRLRLRRVLQLLEENDWTIAHIAEHLHFNDPYAMSRSFQHCYGCPPSTMRKRLVHMSRNDDLDSH